MICDCCRRPVDYVRSSFWLGDARVCRECFAEWCDPDNDDVDTADAASVGNIVRLKHDVLPGHTSSSHEIRPLSTTGR